ncbi:MAG: class I SAM-dependent methyltransferase [Armatimonadota bacterium]|nr:class I SAM-dependent methyltransferase [Armatimonadota bacterium]
MITFITTCKPFVGEFARIQANALASWAALGSGCEVIVFGGGEGVAEACRKLGVAQVEDVELSDEGIPLLNAMIEEAERRSSRQFVGLVNADIMLTSDVLRAVGRVGERWTRFLMIARRWNVELGDEWRFDDGWEDRLRACARMRGELEPRYGGVDLFVFPKGLFARLPGYVVGRGRWDSALIFHARRARVPVVDATATVTCVHQIHGYGHHPRGVAGVFGGADAQRNMQLLGGAEFICTALNATHVLKREGLARQVPANPVLLLRKIAASARLHWWLRPLVPAVRLGAPVWRAARQVADRVRRLARRVRAARAGELPVRVAREPIYSSEVPPGGGVESFDTAEAWELNRARMAHLKQLGLDLRGKTLLDVGSGVGHLAAVLREMGALVTCVDAREENVTRLRELYPGLQARVFDLETQNLEELGKYDVVFAYGVLYHLENPMRALRQFASVCREMLLLETVVVDHELPVVRLVEETAALNQALRGVGSRPSPSYVVLGLRSAGFRYVYVPRVPPSHRDFRFRWRGDLRDSRGGHLLRCVFVASRRPLDNSLLVDCFGRHASA